MAKEAEKKELLPNQIEVFGEVRTLQPLRGRRGRMVIPMMLDMVGALLTAAQAVGLDLKALMDWQAQGGAGFDPVLIKTVSAMLMALGRTVTGEQWDRFERRVLPVLLQEPPDSDRLENEGDPVEIYWAAARAIVYQGKLLSQKEQLTALKQLMAEADRRKNSGEEPTEAP